MLKVAKEENAYRVQLFQVNRLNTLFSDLVREQLSELIRTRGTEVVFNLEGIRFIDSSGFDVLLEISKRARDSGSSFKLCNVGDDVRELISLLDLEGCFDYVSQHDSAEKILQVLD